MEYIIEVCAGGKSEVRTERMDASDRQEES